MWARFPGKMITKHYLLEEIAAAIDSSSANAPGTFGKRVQMTSSSSPSLLLIGDANYDADPGSSRQAGKTHVVQRPIEQLSRTESPGARRRNRRYRPLFQKAAPNSPIAVLTNYQPTEQAVRDWRPKYSLSCIWRPRLFQTVRRRSSAALRNPHPRPMQDQPDLGDRSHPS